MNYAKWYDTISYTMKQETNTQQYGLYVVVDPSIDQNETQSIESRLCETITQQGGEIQQTNEWKKQELAFPIQKNIFAYITTIYFHLDPPNTPKLVEKIKMLDMPVIRYSVTKEPNIPTQEEEQTEETPLTQGTPQAQDATNKDEPRVTIEDIDKKLDEIMDNI